ncbi:hypothetical protein NNX13_04590 [Pseudomonas sp. Eb3]|uniref:hypothetical protein n=1 Tax=Pseudomonas sp. Eb3 TaxID=1327558 RepID=UPI002104225B|nr:hypothetical protein [Pseudomonas sp. Eb3]MCQ1989147.1 hypothetical protein [Pseudomonas sp. Eb3]
MHPAAQQAKLAAALKLITDEADPIQVRVKMAYVWGYIDALADAGLLSQAEADRLQKAAEQRRDKRLADLSADPLLTS